MTIKELREEIIDTKYTYLAQSSKIERITHKTLTEKKKLYGLTMTANNLDKIIKKLGKIINDEV